MSSSSTLALAELRDGPLYRFAVHVLGDGDAGVTEDLRNHMYRRALSQHQRRLRVAQLVRMPVTQPRTHA